MSDDTKSESDETEETKTETSPPPPRRNRGWIRYVILILVLGVGGYWGFEEVRSRFTHVYEYDARIAGSLITVSSRVAGWVTEMNISEGDDISKGQVIVQIDARESELLTEQLVARVRGVDAERNRLIAEKGLVDKQTRSRYQTQKSELAAAEAEAEKKKNSWANVVFGRGPRGGRSLGEQVARDVGRSVMRRIISGSIRSVFKAIGMR